MAQDIGLLLRGLGAAVSNQVPQFRQQMAQEQQDRMRQQEYEAQQAQRAQQARMQNVEMMQARQQATAQDLDAGLKMAARGDWEGLIALGEDRMKIDQQLGGSLKNDMTPMFVNMARRAAAGDAMAGSMLTSQLAQGVSAMYDRGLLQRQQPEIIPGSSVVDGQIITLDAEGNLIAQRPRGFTQAAKPDDSMAAEVSDARSFIRTNVTDINKQLSTITSAYDKINSLLPEMQAGNRAAINAALMNVARLVSPEAVNESDVRRYSGAENEISVLFSLLQGNGVDMDKMLQIVDPLNPQTFNPQTLLGVARSVTASSLPSVLARFEDQKNIAAQYRLSPQFIASYLPENSQLMKSVRGIQQSLGAPLGQTTAQGVYTFRTIQEAEQAVQANQVPVGAEVNIVGPDGRVIDAFNVDPE